MRSRDFLLFAVCRHHRILDRLIGQVRHGGFQCGRLSGELAWCRSGFDVIVPVDSSSAPVATEVCHVVSIKTRMVPMTYG